MNERFAVPVAGAPAARNLALTAVALLAVSLCAVTVWTARERGVAARRAGPAFRLDDRRLPVSIVDDSAAVLSHWRARGVSGRVVVYASRFLHFVPPPEESQVPTLARLSIARSLPQVVVDHRDLLWMAMRQGVGRDFVHLVPPAVLREKAEGSGLAEGEPLTTSELGTPRVLRSSAPRLGEPALVGIDASLFLEPEAGQLLTALVDSDLTSDDLVLSLARDNPAVGEDQRVAMREFAAALHRDREIP